MTDPCFAAAALRALRRAWSGVGKRLGDRLPGGGRIVGIERDGRGKTIFTVRRVCGHRIRSDRLRRLAHGCFRCPGWWRARKRAFSVGETVGGWLILEFLPRSKTDDDPRAYRALCLSCRVTVKTVASTYLSHVRRCGECHRRATTKERRCFTCGVTEAKRFGNAKSICSACDRAANRNGRCESGHALRHHRPCPCGRTAT